MQHGNHIWSTDIGAETKNIKKSKKAKKRELTFCQGVKRGYNFSEIRVPEIREKLSKFTDFDLDNLGPRAPKASLDSRSG